MIAAVQALSRWAIPLLLLGITAWGLSRGVPIYERFVEGAKEGWQTALRVLPYLVGMLVAIQVFQHSGALDQLIRVLTPFTSRLGFPPEALPMALIRPISGSGSLALLSQIFATYGADSFIGRLAAHHDGQYRNSSLYVLTVYQARWGSSAPGTPGHRPACRCRRGDPFFLYCPAFFCIIWPSLDIL